jgi:DNA-binding NarL/FixJ family response regulator
MLLDVLMPGMTGLEALPHISNVAPDTKVVILTAIDTAVLQADEYQRAAATLDKAIGPSKLVKQLEEMFTEATVH